MVLKKFTALNDSTKNKNVWCATIKITTYLKNQDSPISFILALLSVSYPSRGEIYFNTYGRIKPTNTHAEVCIPGVPTIASKQIPVRTIKSELTKVEFE